MRTESPAAQPYSQHDDDHCRGSDGDYPPLAVFRPGAPVNGVLALGRLARIALRFAHSFTFSRLQGQESRAASSAELRSIVPGAALRAALRAPEQGKFSAGSRQRDRIAHSRTLFISNTAL